jgi:hypothetical protein
MFKYEMKKIQCKGCRGIKSFSEYVPSNLKGRNYLCRECAIKHKRNLEKEKIPLLKKQIIENVKRIKCIKCDKKQLISNFYISNLKTHYYVCKKCLIALQKKGYTNRRKKVDEIIKNKGKVKCRKCGESKLVSEFYYESVVQHDYLCKLCFALKRSKYAKENRLKINERNKLKRAKALVKWLEYFKLKGWNTCSKCGYDKCFWAIEFHHKDPKKKSFRINHFYNMYGFTKENIKKLETEAKKCEVLCANCHREEHHKNQNGGLEK